MEFGRLDMLKRMADGIAAQFGEQCEVALHDTGSRQMEHSVIYIVNGHVTGRKVGDGAREKELENYLRQGDTCRDRLCYLEHTADGKLLKCTSLYIRSGRGKVIAVFTISYDLSGLIMAQQAIRDLVETRDQSGPEPIRIEKVLQELIEQSVALVGKPVALMNKNDKIRAIRYLDQAGAFLVTRSGEKVCQYFGISKYTLYAYLDEERGGEKK